MIHAGENIVDGIAVVVTLKRVRRISIVVKRDGRVCMSVPMYRATLKDAETFLSAKWQWVLKAREKAMQVPAENTAPVSDVERMHLLAVLSELNQQWRHSLGEAAFTWRLRRMKSVWGSCNWRKRSITYSLSLARLPREAVEYIVVHEMTHFQAHNHGPRFYELMDSRLPGWKNLRRKLNKGEYFHSGG